MTTLDVHAGSRSLVGDHDAVRDVVQMCLDGEATGDVGKLKSAFHGDAWMFGNLAGTRYDVPIQALFDLSVQSPADTGCYRSRILSITCHGDVATATVAEDGYWGTVSFLDLLALCGWYHAISFIANGLQVPREPWAPTLPPPASPGPTDRAPRST